MKKKVAIIAGGYSSEHGVSLRSAEWLLSSIDRERYEAYIVVIDRDRWAVQLPGGETAPIDRNHFGFETAAAVVRFDFAYITIHGTPGENGLLQGYFDMIQLPYSCCNVLASALTFNKYTCSRFLAAQGVTVPDGIRLRPGDTVDADAIASRLGLPVFVKPNDGGSSFGTTKVKTAAEIAGAVAHAFDEGDEVIIEAFVPGTEVTCGCYKTDEKEVVLPLTEVVTKNEFFDYDAKYNGASDEITPARISPELTRWIQQETSRIYDLVGANGIIRIDYIIPADGRPVMLEVNTTPGMTAASFIPQQVAAAGLNMADIMTDIIEHSLRQAAANRRRR